VEVKVPPPPQVLAGPSPAATPEPPANGVLPEPPQCVVPQPVLGGASGPKRGIFTLQIGALGIKQITFYLDGHKLKTLRQAQAKGGKFAIKVDASKLSYGAHRVSVKTLMSNPNCASISRSGVFVRPDTRVAVLPFTG
jgi:hypothetical protein